MVTFACKKINREDLIRCSFNLNMTEYNVLNFLMPGELTMTPAQIAGEMGLERTTVQKALKKLLASGLVIRRQKNLKKGGYTFFYALSGMEMIKNMMRNTINEWHALVEREINRL